MVCVCLSFYANVMTTKTNYSIAPSIVNNLQCYAISPTQVDITWRSPSHSNGIIRHYEIILRDNDTMQSITKFVNGHVTSATIDHLQPNHNYSCSVAAHTVTRGEISNFAVTISLPRFSK